MSWRRACARWRPAASSSPWRATTWAARAWPPSWRPSGARPARTPKRHHRICPVVRPAEPLGLEAAIAAGGPQCVPALGLWSQPGVFSWDRIDPGSALLIAQPWSPSGAGADLGCGVGVLARGCWQAAAVTEPDPDRHRRRAIAAARRNVDDPGPGSCSTICGAVARRRDSISWS